MAKLILALSEWAGHGNIQPQQEVSSMKRLGILLVVAMFGLALACGGPAEKPADKPAEPETTAPAPDHPKPGEPEPEHPQPKPEHPQPGEPKPEHPK
jgi:hypothetical protein